MTPTRIGKIPVYTITKLKAKTQKIFSDYQLLNITCDENTKAFAVPLKEQREWFLSIAWVRIAYLG